MDTGSRAWMKVLVSPNSSAVSGIRRSPAEMISRDCHLTIPAQGNEAVLCLLWVSSGRSLGKLKRKRRRDYCR